MSVNMMLCMLSYRLGIMQKKYIKNKLKFDLYTGVSDTNRWERCSVPRSDWSLLMGRFAKHTQSTGDGWTALVSAFKLFNRNSNDYLLYKPLLYEKELRQYIK